jgi:hypothetical protein
MSRLPRAALPVAAIAVATLLSGCAGSASRAHGGATAATIAACRSRADEVYDKQNRDQVYRSDTYAGGTRDAPFSSTGLPGITSNGLSGRYARDTLEDDCINGSSANIGASDDTGQAHPAMPTVKQPGP